MYARTRDVNEVVGINKAISQRLDFISIYLEATGFSLLCIFRCGYKFLSILFATANCTRRRIVTTKM